MATIAHGQYPQRRPNGLWRGSSAMVMGFTGTLSKGFLNGLNEVQTTGLDNFVKLLDSRQDPFQRQRGLITVIWGVLPLRMAFQPWNLRWSLGAHDICFKNRLLSTFFTLGQVLPIHRTLHSQHAGLYQPTMTQAVRLLSAYPFKTTGEHTALAPEQPRTVTTQSLLQDLRDPFSEGSLTFSTDGRDVHTAPSAFLSNRHAWVHIFPEGLVHQHAQRQMRYFKWGVARLILEAEPMPDMVPMFIDGTSDIMNESRTWPRAVPRPGKKVHVAFGDRVDMESTFGDLRRRWKALVKKAMEAREAEIAAAERLAEAAAGGATGTGTSSAAKAAAAESNSGRSGIVAALPRRSPAARPDVLRVGDLPDELKHSREAEQIRAEVALRVRAEVAKLRKSLGYADEDPAWGLGLAETWARDPKSTRKSPVDGSAEKPGT
ncbi:putative acyltransferase-like protein [Diaporthe ampelina]|uniref:Tafazzin family protein n=1 Tax=Diaporthe ampelina TaxID=1214573 RepID=A0A0G2HX42_9PEZI|nr:putative acyltransferase-like protein [Diaporthe ampelina]